MDDYSITSLTESKNEWCARLVSLLTHNIAVGINSVFDEAVKLCSDNEEDNKYLMTFQNLLSTIPAWNPTTIENERKRIEQESGCKYLEDLITCVHIIQLKALTCIRVGQKQKKIDIDIPSIDKFVHQVYINTARKLYTNIYLFEKDLFPLQVQKNNRELELLIKEAILTTIRDNIPVERILQCYMEETEVVEDLQQPAPSQSKEPIQASKPDVSKETENNIKMDVIPVDISQNSLLLETKLNNLANEIKSQEGVIVNKPMLITPSAVIAEKLEAPVVSAEKPSINFSEQDNVVEQDGRQYSVSAPKDLETLDKIAEINTAKRKEEEEEDDKLQIGEDIVLDISPITLD